MGITNRIEMLMFIDRGTKQFSREIADEAGQLVQYLEEKPSEYDFLVKLIEHNKKDHVEFFGYLLMLIDDFKRVTIPVNFKLSGYDFHNYCVNKNNNVPVSDRDKDRYLKFMRDVFYFDFSTYDVTLNFLNEYKEHVIPDALLLFSYGEYRLCKEGHCDWEADDELFIIGEYSPEILIIVHDEKVYVMESSREYEKENWKYICDVSNIKEELYKSKVYSDLLWNYTDDIK